MNEDCETAQPLSLAPGGELTIPFTITEMTGNEVESFCDGNDPDATADLVYEVTTSGTCSFFAATSGMVDSEIIVRSVCDVEQFCRNADPDGGDGLALNLTAGTYFVIVQGDPGEHTLSLECAVPICGDAVLNAGEECDDGNLANDDGCDSNCDIEDPDLSVEDCAAAEAGAAVVLSPGLTFVPGMTPLATTLGAVNNATGSCMVQPDGVDTTGSPDHVYRVRVTQAGSLTITLGNGLDSVPFCGPDEAIEPRFPYPAGCWDRSLYVRQADCENPVAEIACDDFGEYWQTESVTFAAAPNTNYFVFVDGWAAFTNGDDSYDRGIYTLEFDLN
jgi:cysteine-rich repeat protein